MEGEWRGARFHKEPQSQNWPLVCKAWLESLSWETGWYETATALRWWRFPVLMKPFREAVEAQARRSGIETFQAWTSRVSPASGELSRAGLEYYMNPLRTLLWEWRPTTSDCLQIWADCEAQVATAFEKGNISPSTALLLFAHPVLLAKVACEVLWTHQQRAEARVPTIMVRHLFRTVPDPAQIAKIEAEYRALFGYAADLVERNAGYGKPPIGMDYCQHLRAGIERVEKLDRCAAARRAIFHGPHCSPGGISFRRPARGHEYSVRCGITLARMLRVPCVSPA